LIPFTKAHACGNDFLIVTDEAAGELDRAELARRLCARSTGVGADGIEFFAWTGPKSGRIRLHNADGSVAEISGNGTRCVAAWMAEALGSKAGDELAIETDAGLRVCRVNGVSKDNGFTVEVTTGMSVPTAARRMVRLADGTEIDGMEVSTGNPHFVIAVENARFAAAGRAWQTVGAEICAHKDFPNQTNVEFVRVERFASLSAGWDRLRLRARAVRRRRRRLSRWGWGDRRCAWWRRAARRRWSGMGRERS